MKIESFEKAYYYVLKNDINSITITNPRKNLIYRPKLHLSSLLGEFICNLSGLDDVDALSHYISSYKKVSDDNNIVNGMIGKRMLSYDSMFDIYLQENPETKEKEFKCEHIVCDQFIDCIEKLNQNNIYNMSIYNKVFDEQSMHPAEIENILWYIDNGNLNATINTNVFDVYIRFPYLSFFISNVMAILATKLDLMVGQVIINFGYKVNTCKDNIEEIYLYDEHDILTENKSDNAEMFKKIYEIEEVSRVQGTTINKEQYEEMLKKIENVYWRSICAILCEYNTSYNFEEYIIDEFKRLPN